MPAQGPFTPINLNTSGDHVVIAGIAGQIITIYSLVLWSAAAVTVILKDGAVALNGANGFNLPTQYLLNLQLAFPSNALILTAGNGFGINLGGNVNVNGWVQYNQPLGQSV